MPLHLTLLLKGFSACSDLGAGERFELAQLVRSTTPNSLPCGPSNKEGSVDPHAHGEHQ